MLSDPGVELRRQRLWQGLLGATSEGSHTSWRPRVCCQGTRSAQGHRAPSDQGICCPCQPCPSAKRSGPELPPDFMDGLVCLSWMHHTAVSELSFSRGEDVCSYARPQGVGLGKTSSKFCCLQIHNVELLPGRGGQLARAAGTSATLVSRGARSPPLYTHNAFVL